MTSLIEWLLDLERIRLDGGGPVVLKWNPPVPAWVLFGFALLALTCIALSYRKERGSWIRRLLPAVIRCGVVAVVTAAICRPSLVLQRNRVEPSYVVLALDTSLSMATAERYSDGVVSSSILRGAGLTDPDELKDHTRLELARKALLSRDAAPLRALLERNGIELCTFAGRVKTLGFYQSPGDGARTIPGELVDTLESTQPAGKTTDLAGALRHIVEKTQGRRLAAIVMVTDGRSTQPTNLADALDMARDRQIPIFPLRIGSTDIPWDIEVGPVRAPHSVFPGDVFTVEAQLTARGLRTSLTAAVRLFDERTGQVVATRQIALDGARSSATVELIAKPTQTGMMRLRVEVPPHQGELSAENNAERIEVTVSDNRRSVLYVEGYPRYEYRYLKNALLRERTVDLSVLLLEADRRFIQEGTNPIRRFPETPEELNRYDVVLFGDVDPHGGWLTGAQMEMLLNFVGNRGGGFGLIAGERAAPQRFRGTLLERLIPVRIDPTFSGALEAPILSGFHARLTGDGLRSGFFRFTTDQADSEHLLDVLPELYWFAPTLGPKPGASVLIEHPTIRAPGYAGFAAAGAMPIVVTGRYGAGKIFFQATDDTWRWRRHTGEFLHDAYWVRVVRSLMPGSRIAANRRLTVRTDRRVYPYGSTVRAEVEILDLQLLAEQGDRVRIVVGKDDTPSTLVGRFNAHRTGPESALFEGSWVPSGPGGFEMRVVDFVPLAGERAPSARFRVEPPVLETRQPQADHETLERLAAATGGRMIDLDRLETEFRAVKDRSLRIPDDLEEPLWDSRLVLLVFVAMISMEWVLRKAFGLL